MTNYEQLIKNKPELVKNILSTGISIKKGIVKPCSETMCFDCDFGGQPFCSKAVKKWLNAEQNLAMQQKEKEVQWIYNEDDDTITCSNCQTWFITTTRSSFMRYCPYCGRKMKSEK